MEPVQDLSGVINFRDYFIVVTFIANRLLSQTITCWMEVRAGRKHLAETQ